MDEIPQLRTEVGVTVDRAELWDSPLADPLAAPGAFWRGLSEADSLVAELESLRAEFRKLARERSELHRDRDEWRRRAERAEAITGMGGVLMSEKTWTQAELVDAFRRADEYAEKMYGNDDRREVAAYAFVKAWLGMES